MTLEEALEWSRKNLQKPDETSIPKASRSQSLQNIKTRENRDTSTTNNSISSKGLMEMSNEEFNKYFDDLRSTPPTLHTAQNSLGRWSSSFDPKTSTDMIYLNNQT